MTTKIEGFRITAGSMIGKADTLKDARTVAYTLIGWEVGAVATITSADGGTEVLKVTRVSTSPHAFNPRHVELISSTFI